jgi:hypothetical protein
MAYIVLSGKRDVDPAEASNKMLLSDLDYNRTAYWAAKTFFPHGVLIPGTPGVPDVPGTPEVQAQDAVFDENGNVVTPAVEYQPEVPAVPAVPAVPDSYRPPNGLEVFRALTDYVYADISQKVYNFYVREEQAAAIANVQPIQLTPDNQ